MLIDTNQIVQKTDLRLRLSEIIEEVYRKGKTYIIADRGSIKGKITPVSENKKAQVDLLDQINKLRQENDRYFSKTKSKGWISVKLIRKLRQNRTDELMKFSKTQ